MALKAIEDMALQIGGKTSSGEVRALSTHVAALAAYLQEKERTATPPEPKPEPEQDYYRLWNEEAWKRGNAVRELEAAQARVKDLEAELRVAWEDSDEVKELQLRVDGLALQLGTEKSRADALEKENKRLAEHIEKAAEQYLNDLKMVRGKFGSKAERADALEKELAKAREEHDAIAVAAGLSDYAEGQGPVYGSPSEVVAEVKRLRAELERARTVIRTGGAMYRAERARMGIPGGIDPDEARTQAGSGVPKIDVKNDRGVFVLCIAGEGLVWSIHREELEKAAEKLRKYWPPASRGVDPGPQEETLGWIRKWTLEHGAALKPVGADTYGEGMREAKRQVARLLDLRGAAEAGAAPGPLPVEEAERLATKFAHDFVFRWLIPATEGIRELTDLLMSVAGRGVLNAKPAGGVGADELWKQLHTKQVREVVDGAVAEAREEERARFDGLRDGCIANFRGGHVEDYDAFVHGMQTVCNVVDDIIGRARSATAEQAEPSKPEYEPCPCSNTSHPGAEYADDSELMLTGMCRETCRRCEGTLMVEKATAEQAEKGADK